MPRKDGLRLQRAGTVLNLKSSKQETEMAHALAVVVERLITEFGLPLDHRTKWKLTEIVESLRADFPEVPFAEVRADTSMEPDGGVLSIVDANNEKHVILIVEVKNQGTNDARAKEGLKKQSRGNAIERLGKNLIGFRTAMLTEDIMPFVCFGYGCDFEDVSSILERVTTMAMFGPLNEICVLNLGDARQFNRGSFFFREPEWKRDEMVDVMYEVAKRSIHYYFAKHGESSFQKAD